jgi:hypothetical protein
MSNSCAPAPAGHPEYPARLVHGTRQANNEFYKDEEELVVNRAAAVDAELHDL